MNIYEQEDRSLNLLKRYLSNKKGTNDLLSSLVKLIQIIFEYRLNKSD